MTSHDVVDRIREITGERRVGHAGTLDPNATGLLIVGVGRASTRRLGVITKGTKKIYEALIILGEERDTDDAEGKVVVKAKGVLPPIRKEIANVLRGFLGMQTQVPPRYSAVKLQGKKAYELARYGKKITLNPRKVRIYRIKLLRYKYPKLEIKVEVSAGTYIRALARDVGRRLGMGAYLSDLRRTNIGSYSVEQAVHPDLFSERNWHRFAVT